MRIRTPHRRVGRRRRDPPSPARRAFGAAPLPPAFDRPHAAAEQRPLVGPSRARRRRRDRHQGGAEPRHHPLGFLGRSRRRAKRRRTRQQGRRLHARVGVLTRAIRSVRCRRRAPRVRDTRGSTCPRSSAATASRRAARRASPARTSRATRSRPAVWRIAAPRDDSKAGGPQPRERPRPSRSARQRRRSTSGCGLGRDGSPSIPR